VDSDKITELHPNEEAYMVRMADIPEIEKNILMGMECPSFETSPWAFGQPLNQRRVAMITTSGLHLRSDRPFQMGQRDLYRVIPGDAGNNDLVMSHGAASFDRTGYQRDLNVVFPIDRLRELAAEAVIGSLADYHYAFGTPLSLSQSETAAKELGDLLKKDNVNALLLFPV
jgi:D-proline reductase (dithiol) PrdB